jgi:excisionase family DNA binding protein
MTAAQRILTVPELAAHLRISRPTAYRLLKSGAIPTIRIGAHLRITEGALNRYLDGREREAEALLHPRRRLRAV